MTIEEIIAVRKAESAILATLENLHAETGLCPEQVFLSHVEITRFEDQSRKQVISTVRIEMERI